MRKILAVLFVFSFAGTLDAGEHSSTKMAGWTVSADPQVDKAQLDTLEATLKDLNAIFPAKLLTVIQRVPIQVDGGGDGNQKHGTIKTGAYEGRWTVTNGVMKPIGVGRIHLFSSRDCGNKILLVHELSHAAQSLTIGIDNVRVKKAYAETVKHELYPKTSYLMTNAKEYFAEMSVVYLSKLHYFPHDRETLQKHDPTSYKLMEDFWGKASAPAQKPKKA